MWGKTSVKLMDDFKKSSVYPLSFSRKKYKRFLPRDAGLSGSYLKRQTRAFDSPNKTKIELIFWLYWKHWFCDTSNIANFLAKSEAFRNLKTALMSTIGTGANNPETWALKRASTCVKKTDGWRQINWWISFSEKFYCDLHCFFTISIVTRILTTLLQLTMPINMESAQIAVLFLGFERNRSFPSVFHEFQW